jgi:CPA1 family monovalent cation:H+ antiporter
MTPLAFFAILLTLASVFGVLNHRTLRLPNTIGVLLVSLLVSAIMLVADPLVPGYDLKAIAQSLLGTIDLPQALLNGVLSFLLFAGALQVDLGQLWARKLSVMALALVGTVLAVGLFGGGMWLLFPVLGQPVPLVWCTVLGAILAPTDPVSVVGMLRRIGLPAPLQAVFAGKACSTTAWELSFSAWRWASRPATVPWRAAATSWRASWWKPSAAA